MATKQDPAKEDPKPTPDPVVPTDDPKQTTAGSTPPDDGTPKGYVSEESYKGLQRVLTKKDTDLEKLQTQVDDLSTQIEEVKGTSTGLATSKSDLETQLEEAKSSTETLQTERDDLSKKVERQSVIMTDFPQLATLADYIPPADDAEGFKKNAEDFSNALGVFVKDGVTEKITGATPPVPVGKEDTTAQQAEIDQLWETMMKTGGNPEKLDDFETAQKRYEELMPDSPP